MPAVVCTVGGDGGVGISGCSIDGDDKRTLFENQYLIDLEHQAKQQHSSVSPEQSTKCHQIHSAKVEQEISREIISYEQNDPYNKEGNINNNDCNNGEPDSRNISYEQMYHNLLKQYRQFEAMLLNIGKNRTYNATSICK